MHRSKQRDLMDENFGTRMSFFSDKTKWEDENFSHWLLTRYKSKFVNVVEEMRRRIKEMHESSALQSPKNAAKRKTNKKVTFLETLFYFESCKM